jgi:phospho-N-acetylmuramoyl-pentapeptide-transferase
MLYYIFFKELFKYFSAFRVFQYITFRAIYATVTALLISLVLGPFVIKKLRMLQFGQVIRDDGPETHFSKAGTPAIGGLLILVAVFTSTVLWARFDISITFIVLFSIVWFGALGFIDDYLKITRQHSSGLRAWYKIILQAIGAFVIVYYIYQWGDSPHELPNGLVTAKTALVFPFKKNFRPDLGILFIPFAMLVIIGASNAVNLTDGLDGLAIGCTLFVAGTFAVVAHLTSNQITANYLDLVHLPASGEVAVFCATIIGAGLGFLWFNAHPAKVFMGDTGALALGAAIGTVAVLIKEEFFLFIVGGIFVAEALSDIIQVVSCRMRRGKRVFLMTPLHHHFEKLGWPESRIVIRFWIIAAILVLIALSTLKLR